MYSKRLFDLLLTIPGLLILLPVFFVIAVIIKTDTGGPIFFRQVRAGKYGQPFRIFKFRTMVVNSEKIGQQITVGNVLRKYKLDELPQLLNVLKGEMSIVGPRPEVPEYVKYWPQETKELVLSISPGITDIASIEFKNENELLEKAENPAEKYIQEIIPIKLEYYVKYVRDRNLLMDLRLIVKTIKEIVT